MTKETPKNTCPHRTWEMSDDALTGACTLCLKERVRELEELIKRVENHLASEKQTVHELEKKLAIAEEALNDFAEHGTRHDLNPTGQMMPCGHFEVRTDAYQYRGFMKSMDEYVRSRAKEALRSLRNEGKGEK